VLIKHTKPLGDHLKVQTENLNNDQAGRFKNVFEVPIGTSVALNSEYMVVEADRCDGHGNIIDTEMSFVPMDKFIQVMFGHYSQRKHA
jgi:hypothetical protein